MNQETAITEIRQSLRRIERQLAETKKPMWVRYSVIKDLTGWDNKGMEKARVNGYVAFKKDSDGMWYDLNSVHPHLIKKTA